MQKTTFKYKLDFYYQQTLIYLFTLVLYAGVRGSFVEDQFSFVFRDPIVYVIIIFFITSVVVLVLNILRDRKLIITAESLIFHSRHRDRMFPIEDIEWLHIGKERFVQTAGHFQQISIKIKDRPMAIRIRVGRYEHSRELVSEMEKIAQRVPPRPGNYGKIVHQKKLSRLFE
ncbi:MAG TPA: hypothetical protein VMU30_05545 [Bacteroidota bacterium]|nr:hypothetical protein [Bacteroidota bacterium]